MSVPPQLIRVKRKATDEDPVSFLRVQETKRHRSETFVYRRQEERPKFADNIPAESPKPVIHTSQPHTKATAFLNSKTSEPSIEKPVSDNGATLEPAGVSSADTASPADAASEPRQFRMSKKDMMRGASQLGRAHGGITKKRSSPALFVERKIKHISNTPLKKLEALTNTASSAAAEDMEVDKPEPRKLKKPGIAKLAPKKKDDQNYKADVPKSMTDRWNVDVEKLGAEMNEYTLQQIGLNLQKVNDEKVSEESAKAQSKFKPKPITRYAERHPETTQGSRDVDMMNTDADVSDSDDGEYIIETYERVPASKLGEHVSPKKVGLIVFDEDPEMEFFYGDDSDSEAEWAEDEEDENAENYYAADYPEDEVASDDEYNYNAYSFRNRNASDLEEYDLDDDDDDDDDDDEDEDKDKDKGKYKDEDYGLLSDREDEIKMESDGFTISVGRAGNRIDDNELLSRFGGRR
ncbi:hypothetical protein GGR52DRAFT_12006 [Hypoxylon sp. FL1284]|nr:hypothetical protein GGR52DRAFT_12006 [Hypoxylon sp. FL1284]